MKAKPTPTATASFPPTSLAEYVHTNVRLATNAAQNPTSERGSFDPNMVLAYNPGHVTAANLPPPKYGTLVIETNMDGTEVFVDGKSAGVVNKARGLRLPGIEPGRAYHQSRSIWAMSRTARARSRSIRDRKRR